MDTQEYRQFIAILEDMLLSVHIAVRDLPSDKPANEAFRQMQVKLEKAIQAYREKL